MPDKKLTDNEIKKALECCSKSNTDDDYCTGCPYEFVKYCASEISKDTLDLINRLQAENERLTADSKRLKKVQMQLDDMCKMYHIIKAEAYKEFAEKLLDAYEIWTDNDELEYKYVAELVDNLLKELVGDA